MEHLSEGAKCNKKLDKKEPIGDTVKNAQKTRNKRFKNTFYYKKTHVSICQNRNIQYLSNMNFFARGRGNTVKTM